MKGNKLKHNFTENSPQFTALQNAVRQQQRQNIMVVEPELETILVTNEITNDLIEFKDIIKKEMVREITKILYDSDLINVVEINNVTTTKIKMEIKVKKT